MTGYEIDMATKEYLRRRNGQGGFAWALTFQSVISELVNLH